jgi:protein SCO1/2
VTPWRSLVLALVAAFVAAPAAAHSTLKPGETASLAFRQHPGAPLPLDAALVDEAGRPVRLGDLFAGKPVILVLDYFHCETLCGVVLDNLAAALEHVPLAAGRDFVVVAASIDPREGPADARAAMARHRGRQTGSADAAGWRFLTGPEASIDRLADAIGLPFRYDAAIDQFAHPAGLVLAAPDGTIARYLLGVDFRPIDLRLGLAEAARGAVAAPAAGLLLLCYHYDPETGRYDVQVQRALQVAGGLTVLGLALMVARLRGTRRG